MAFEVWLDHGSESKKPPEQLHIVLQVIHFAFTVSYKSIPFVESSFTLVAFSLSTSLCFSMLLYFLTRKEGPRIAAERQWLTFQQN
jgi:hypothetical protein